MSSPLDFSAVIVAGLSVVKPAMSWRAPRVDMTYVKEVERRSGIVPVSVLLNATKQEFALAHVAAQPRFEGKGFRRAFLLSTDRKIGAIDSRDMQRLQIT